MGRAAAGVVGSSRGGCQQPAAAFRCARQEHRTDCGPAALVSVAWHHGLRCSPGRARRLARGDSSGASLWGLALAARALGFEARGVRADSAALDDVPLPCIALQDRGVNDHYVVVFARDGAAGLWIGDPTEGRVRRRSRAWFLRRWRGILLLLEWRP